MKYETSGPATRQDLQLLELATRQRVQHLEQTLHAGLERLHWAMDLRFEAERFERRFDELARNLEFRIVWKLGTLMVILWGLLLAAMLHIA